MSTQSPTTKSPMSIQPSYKLVLTTSLTFSLLTLFISFLSNVETGDSSLLGILTTVLPIFFSCAAVLSVTQAALGRKFPLWKHIAIFLLSPIITLPTIMIVQMMVPYLWMLMPVRRYVLNPGLIFIPKLMIAFIYWSLLSACFIALFRRRIPVYIVPAVSGAALLVELIAIGLYFLTQTPNGHNAPVQYSIISMLQTFSPLTTLGLILHRYAPVILDQPQITIPYKEEIVPDSEPLQTTH